MKNSNWAATSFDTTMQKDVASARANMAHLALPKRDWPQGAPRLDESTWKQFRAAIQKHVHAEVGYTAYDDEVMGALLGHARSFHGPTCAEHFRDLWLKFGLNRVAVVDDDELFPGEREADIHIAALAPAVSAFLAEIAEEDALHERLKAEGEAHAARVHDVAEALVAEYAKRLVDKPTVKRLRKAMNLRRGAEFTCGPRLHGNIARILFDTRNLEALRGKVLAVYIGGTVLSVINGTREEEGGYIHLPLTDHVDALVPETVGAA